MDGSSFPLEFIINGFRSPLPISRKSLYISLNNAAFSVTKIGFFPLNTAYLIIAAACLPFPTPVISPMIRAFPFSIW